jgi:transcriptional regulator with XRE-family HTH domain
MSHPSEELLVPISGRVNYCWLSPAKDTYEINQHELTVPVRLSQLLRVNSSIPHATWAVGNEPTSAWMIFLDVARSGIAIRSKNGPGQDPRFVSLNHFINHPEYYAIAATGLAETIRVLRASAGLEITQLAEKTGLDRATLSRLENFSANPSLDKIVKISEVLGFDAADLLLRPLWFCQRYDLSENKPVSNEKFKSMEKAEPNTEFCLHHRCFKVTKGPEKHPLVQLAISKETMISWIVLEGDLLVDLSEPAHTEVSAKQKSCYLGEELLKAGSVLHFRRSLDCKIETRSDCEAKILEITYSPLPQCPKA